MLWADFLFAAVGEQFGLVGCGVLLAGPIALLRLAHRPPVRDLLRHVSVRGVFTMLIWQIVPERRDDDEDPAGDGLPLPFISYGGRA